MNRREQRRRGGSNRIERDNNVGTYSKTGQQQRSSQQPAAEQGRNRAGNRCLDWINPDGMIQDGMGWDVCSRRSVKCKTPPGPCGWKMEMAVACANGPAKKGRGMARYRRCL